VILLFTGPRHRGRSFPALSEFEIIGTLWACEVGLVCGQHRGCWTCVGLQMGSNFLGPFTLTIRLLPPMLADLMFTQHLAAVAAQRDWNLTSTAAQPRQARLQLLPATRSIRGRAPGAM